MEKFDKLIDKNKSQVFVFTCPGNFPFVFATHTWLVINKKGIISRFEILFRKTKHKTSWGHLHLNFFPPFQGIEVIPFYKKFFWRGKLLGQVEETITEGLISFIEDTPKGYPYINKYFLIGPNSNTYIQWLLNKFPEIKIKLPWNSFGKNY